MLLPRVFTVYEANVLVPLLEQHMGRVAKLYRDARKLHQSLEVGASAAEGAAVGEAKDVHQSLEKLEAKIAGEVQAMTRLGVMVKGFAPPSVDAPALRDGVPVNLCWTVGDPAFLHWHRVSAGCDDREPIGDESAFGAPLLQ